MTDWTGRERAALIEAVLRDADAKRESKLRAALAVASPEDVREAVSANLVAAQNTRLATKKSNQKASLARVPPSATIGTGRAEDEQIPASPLVPLVTSAGEKQ